MGHGLILLRAERWTGACCKTEHAKATKARSAHLLARLIAGQPKTRLRACAGKPKARRHLAEVSRAARPATTPTACPRPLFASKNHGVLWSTHTHCAGPGRARLDTSVRGESRP
eukprot:12919793-Alexandrium_andersonii.AAC.1